eukprot:COSAG05_NODE_1089_length_5920_cov_2.369009_6_plen_226_part_00
MALTMVMLCLLAILAIFLMRLIGRQNMTMETIKTRYLVLNKIWRAKTILGFESSQQSIEKDSRRPPLSDTIRILVGNFQIIGTLPMTFRASFLKHLPFTQHLFDLLQLFDMDVIGLVNLDCLLTPSLYGSFFLTVFTPIVLVAIIQVKHRLKYCGKKFNAGERGSLLRTHSILALTRSKMVAKKMREKVQAQNGTAANQKCMFIIFFFYPPCFFADLQDVTMSRP